MTAFLPTTRVTVRRSAEDPALSVHGDETDDLAVVATGVPCAVGAARAPRSFTNGDQRSFVPAENRGGVIERYLIRFRPNADVIEQDQLFDERQGVTYLVTDVSHPQSVVGMADVRVTAHRVAVSSQAVNA